MDEPGTPNAESRPQRDTKDSQTQQGWAMHAQLLSPNHHSDTLCNSFREKEVRGEERGQKCFPSGILLTET